MEITQNETFDECVSRIYAQVVIFAQSVTAPIIGYSVSGEYSKGSAWYSARRNMIILNPKTCLNFSDELLELVLKHEFAHWACRAEGLNVGHGAAFLAAQIYIAGSIYNYEQSGGRDLDSKQSISFNGDYERAKELFSKHQNEETLQDFMTKISDEISILESLTSKVLSTRNPKTLFKFAFFAVALGSVFTPVLIETIENFIRNF